MCIGLESLAFDRKSSHQDSETRPLRKVMNHQPRKLLEPSVIYSTQKMKKSLMEIFIFYVVLPFSKMAVEIGFTLLSY